MLFGEFFSLFIVDDSQILQIRLVSGDRYDNFGGCIFFELLDPFFHPFKRLSGHNFVRNYGPDGIFIVDGGNGIIFLLSSSVLALGVRIPR